MNIAFDVVAIILMAFSMGINIANVKTEKEAVNFIVSLILAIFIVWRIWA